MKLERKSETCKSSFVSNHNSYSALRLSSKPSSRINSSKTRRTKWDGFSRSGNLSTIPKSKRSTSSLIRNNSSRKRNTGSSCSNKIVTFRANRPMIVRLPWRNLTCFLVAMSLARFSRLVESQITSSCKTTHTSLVGVCREARQTVRVRTAVSRICTMSDYRVKPIASISTTRAAQISFSASETCRVIKMRQSKALHRQSLSQLTLHAKCYL